MKLYSVLISFLSISCTSLAQDETKMIQQLDTYLTNGKITISEILSDNHFMSLHPVTEFRQLIKKYANTEKVKMVTDDEPGTKITVKAVVKTKSGELMKNVLVYLYQTSDKGWYAADRPHVDGNEGDHGHARLFTYVKTNDKGEFEISTILPKGYPNSDLPAHIHVQMWKDGTNIPGVPGELLFDEDERLTPERKQRAIREGFLVEKNRGTAANPVYQYTIIVNS
jgi:protocatechuate 3,4-dioxygenase beta subunit